MLLHNDFRDVQTRPGPNVVLDVVPLFELVHDPAIVTVPGGLVLEGQGAEGATRTRLPGIPSVLEALSVARFVTSGYLSFQGQGPSVSVAVDPALARQIEIALRPVAAPSAITAGLDEPLTAEQPLAAPEESVALLRPE